jgi:AraC family transcriptional regulator
LVRLGTQVPARYRGLEQFRLVANSDGVNYCVADARPYALEFENNFDVICLLFGDINSRTKFEDEPERELTFRGETSAFHPRGGSVRVNASDVRHGFIAFGYSPEFQSAVDDTSLAKARNLGSRTNLDRSSIKHLARYAREHLRAGDMQDIEIQFLASLVLLETSRQLGVAKEPGSATLSDREFRAVSEYVEAELANNLTCQNIAEAVNLPLRAIFDGIKHRTGYSPYQFVLEKRVERARSLLTGTSLPIAEVALACGFGSQQHLTSTLSRKLGTTPGKLRERDPQSLRAQSPCGVSWCTTPMDPSCAATCEFILPEQARKSKPRG